MPLNLLKKYNELLNISGLDENQRKKTLWGIFDRDFIQKSDIYFNNKKITPTPLDGTITMDILFSHLTTRMIDKTTRKREFDKHRAERLHWVGFHLEKKKEENLLIFSVEEPEGIRTYIYDKVEEYVIILEPLQKKQEYYLLTAYKLTGKDGKRDKIMKKYKRRMSNLV